MSEYTRITFKGDWNHPLSKVVEQAFELSRTNIRLHPELLTLEGMSGVCYRNFINTLVSMLGKINYLEVGSWLGSTACSVIYSNAVNITCIDNWSEFGGPKKQFLNNIELSSNDNTKFSFIEKDFREVDYTSIGLFNIYLFDGPHNYEDQKDGIIIAQPALSDVYLLIVDDFNWQEVRAGTVDALKELNSKVISFIEIRTSEDDSHPKLAGSKSNWHNGYFIAVIQK